MDPQSSICPDDRPDRSSRNIVHRSSPTSVVEEQCLELVEIDNNHERIIEAENCSDSLAELLRERYKRPRIGILPTITELPSFEEQNEPDGNSTHFSLILADDDLSSHMRTLATPMQQDFGYDEVDKLCDAAAACASTGNEEKAIALYKDGLRMLRHGVRRISKEMKTVANKPKLEKTALFIVLHEEWTEVALIIAKTRTMMAIMYERQGDYEKAIRCCEEARAVYQRQASFDERHNKKYSDAQQKAIAMDHMVLKIEEARESSPARKMLHETAKRIHEKIEATSDETSLNFLFEDIFDKLTTALTLEILHLGETHPQVADTQAFLSILFQQRGLIQRAEKLMIHSVTVCELALGKSHPRTGLRYREAAKMFETIGGTENLTTAIELYEKAISTLRSAYGDFSDMLSSVLNDVGVLYMRQNDFDMAVRKLSEAIDLCYVNTIAGIEERQSADLIQIWLNLAECYALRTEPDLATHAARSALGIQRDLRTKFDANHNGRTGVPMPFLLTNVSVASTLERLGNSLAKQKKFDLSYGALLEALSILQTDYSEAQEAAKSNPTIDLAKHQDEVASMLYSLAEVKQVDERYAEAIRLYQESLQLHVGSDRMRVAIGKEKSNLVRCAMCLGGVGSIQLAQGDASEAFKAFNQAIHYVRKQGLSASHPIPTMLWENSHVAAAKMRETKSLATFYESASTGNDEGSMQTYSSKSIELDSKSHVTRLNDMKVDKLSEASHTRSVYKNQRNSRGKKWTTARFPKRRYTRGEF